MRCDSRLFQPQPERAAVMHWLYFLLTTTVFAPSTLVAATMSFAPEGMVPMLGPTQTVALDNATFIGIIRGQTALFLGIPYAHPP